jgi:beta-lactamase regulating signal transducer with metallopeptidase domain
VQGDGSGGFFLLLTESFAVRAMLGSLAAAGLVYLAVRTTGLRTNRARRILVLAPATVAAAAAVLSIGEAFLPRFWVATTAGSSAGQILDFLGEPWFLAPQREIDLLLIAWLVVASTLLARRAAGALLVRRLLARSRLPIGYAHLAATVERLAQSMAIRTPQLLLLPRCPGGAFTARILRPVVVVDPAVVDGLDDRETEGLLAHELAHIRRRDNLVAGALGVFRDLAFFLPPLHLAVRWFRVEREESADELACAHTNRPGAMASGILKVWDTCRIARRTVGCAAVPARSLVFAGAGTVSALGILEQRVERLIQERTPLSGLRKRVEVGAASAITGAAVVAAVMVPAWVVSRYDAAAIAVGYLAAPPVTEVEAPVFATFRRLAPERAETAGQAGGAALTGDPASACPCVETRTQWLDPQPVTVPEHARAMAWGSSDRATWELRSLESDRPRDARPLLTVSDPAQHVGFFVLGAAPQTP